MADDYGNDIYNASYVAFNSAKFGTVEEISDADFFYNYFYSGETYQIELKGSSSGSGSLDDPHVYLYDDYGDLIAQNDDYSSLDSFLSFSPSYSGYYYISARDHGDNSTGTYRLDVGRGGPTNGDDVISGTSGPDTIDALDGDDIVNGNGGDDVIGGNYGNDTIYGNAGNDRVNGSYGDDFVYGGDGNDNVRGGPGFDQLYGGAGQDDFDFDLVTDSVVGSRRDVIYTFQRGPDDIDITGIGTGKAGQAAFKFVDTKAFTAAGQVRETVINGDTVVQGNTDADRTPEFEIGLDGRFNLAASDFAL